MPQPNDPAFNVESVTLSNLRRVNDDLAALSTLSASWMGRDQAYIAESLAEALSHALRSGLIYICLTALPGADKVEAAWYNEHAETPARAQEIGRVLPSQLSPDMSDAVVLAPDPLGRGMLHLITVPIGAGSKWGWMAAGAQRPDFPTEQERLLLRVGGVQAANALQALSIQTSLQESEERFHILADVAPIGIYQTDTQGSVVYTNPRWQAFSGLTYEESLGYGWNRADHPADRERVMAEWLAAIQAGREFLTECRMLSTFGDVRWVIGRAAPILSANGRLTGYVGTVEDITARKQREETLRTREARYRQQSEELDSLVRKRTEELNLTVVELNTKAGELEQADQTSRAQAETLIRTIEQLAHNHPLKHLREIVLAAISNQLGAVSMTLWWIDTATGGLRLELVYQGGRVTPGARSDMPHRTLTQEERQKDPIWRRLAEERQAIVYDLETIAARASKSTVTTTTFEYLAAQAVKRLVAVPLILGEEMVGFLNIRLTEDTPVPPEKIALAQALVHQMTLAVHISQLTEQAQQTAVLQERNRIAREIHDTLAQAFTGILMQVGAAERLSANSPDGLLAYLQNIREVAQEGLAEARHSMLALRPQALEQTDLASALEHMLQQQDTNGTPRLEFHLHGTPQSLRPDVTAHLLRIGQEALTNALRHARANTIRMDLTYTETEVRLSVEDDGRGFTAGTSEPQDGFGLIGMRERADMIGAELAVAHRSMRGTRVNVTLRVPQD